MKVNLLAFGIAKDILGTNHLIIDFEGKDSQELKESLETQFPRLKQLPAYLIAVNNEYASYATAINNNDEVAIIPPVSGG